MHALLADLRELASEMQSGECNHAFRPTGEWQCRRCGIASEDFRDRGTGVGCLICSDLPDALIGPTTGAVQPARPRTGHVALTL